MTHHNCDATTYFSRFDLFILRVVHGYGGSLGGVSLTGNVDFPFAGVDPLLRHFLGDFVAVLVDHCRLGLNLGSQCVQHSVDAH